MKIETYKLYKKIASYITGKIDSLESSVVKKSSTTGLLKNDGTVDTNTYLTSHQSLSNYVEKSNITGLLKNDGTVDTNTYLTSHQSLTNYVQKSQTSGLLKNDGTVDTNTYLTQHQNITGKADKINGANQITDTNSNLYNYIGTLNSGATQQDINNALNTVIGSLLSVNLVEVTSNKGNASASTMNKLYLVPEATVETNDAYEIFVTVRTGTSPNYIYNWEKIDKVRIDLSNYIQKSQIVGLLKNDGTIDTNTYSTFSGNYNDLSNKPTIPSSSSDLNDGANIISKSDIEDLKSLFISLTFSITGNSFTTYNTTPFNFTGSLIIDWGDGTTTKYTSGQLTHNYSTSDEYFISIVGDIKGFNAHCFRGTGLSDITIPNYITTINPACFYNCRNLTDIVIPNHITSIGQSALSKTSLSEIDIPNSVTSIGINCFKDCTDLEKIVLNWSTSETIPTYDATWISGVNANCVFSIPYGTTSLYTAKSYPSELLVERITLTCEANATNLNYGEYITISGRYTIDNVGVANQSLKMEYTVESSNITTTISTDENGYYSVSKRLNKGYGNYVFYVKDLTRNFTSNTVTVNVS